MAKLQYTPVDEIPQIHDVLNRTFRSGKTKPIDYRKEQLLQLAYLLEDNRQRLVDALFDDLMRPREESALFEIDETIGTVKDAYDNVAKWSATERTPFSAQDFPMSPAIRKEPKGVVLMIAPFNFPILLLLSPLASAIAAGCAAVLKPSELTPATSALLAELLPKYLDQAAYRLVNGAIPETTKLLELPWNHIIYTGNGRVAKIVSHAAAEHLTPVTLELGGKSAVVIDPKCDLPTAARRVLWGKIMNAGQVCIAPDYVLVPRHFQDTFVAALQKAHEEFFPIDPIKVPDAMGHIVSDAHVQRLKRLIDGTRGTIVIGGQVDADRRFVAPTVVKDVKGDDSLMSEEIFGPVLPIVPVEDVDEAIAFVNNLDYPLAIYVFSKDAAFKSKVFDNTQSGAAVANEVILHIGVDRLPFGGIGPSGSGCTTGKFGFDTFTHFRGTVDNPSWADKLLLSARYPPYNRGAIQKMTKRMRPSLPPRPGTKSSLLKRWQLWFALGTAGLIAKLNWRSLAATSA